jgi:branched-chain amino acid transport system ATP-binding protein
MLTIQKLNAFYGKSHVLHEVNLSVGAGEIVALLGRNGSGRSTTAKAIMGLVECHGSIVWKDQQIQGRRTFEVAHLGIGYVPENRDISPRCTNCSPGSKSASTPRRA